MGTGFLFGAWGYLTLGGNTAVMPNPPNRAPYVGELYGTQTIS